MITRTRAQADPLSEKLDHVYRLDGDDQDLAYEATDNIVAGYHLTKGLEFDAVVDGMVGLRAHRRRTPPTADRVFACAA